MQPHHGLSCFATIWTDPELHGPPLVLECQINLVLERAASMCLKGIIVVCHFFSGVFSTLSGYFSGLCFCLCDVSLVFYVCFFLINLFISVVVY